MASASTSATSIGTTHSGGLRETDVRSNDVANDIGASHNENDVRNNDVCDDVGTSPIDNGDGEAIRTIPIPSFQSINISIGAELNAAVQADLEIGICNSITDVGIVAEHNPVPLEEPAVGMVYPSCLQMLATCHTYAKQTGFQFSVRNSQFIKEKDVEVDQQVEDEGFDEDDEGGGNDKVHNTTKKQKVRKASMYLNCKVIRIACKKRGEFVGKGRNVDKPTRSGKCECTVFIDGALDTDGQFRIRSCNLVHKHELNVTGTRFMVNYRIIGQQEQHILLTNYYAGIPVSRNYKALSVWVGGPAFLKFTENDARNFLKFEKRQGRINGDAKAMLSYFSTQRKQNSRFYCDITKDKDGRLLNVFWADARCRAAFNDFDEVVTFDTTHLINQYAMPLAMFVGVNHHGSSIIFALALISHEDGETFSWIFNQWLTCMGKPPKAILTDQCGAIKVGLETVFPQVPHRLCIWHILANAKRHLCGYKDFGKIYAKMKIAVHDSWSLEEFVEIWLDLVAEFDIAGNSWVQEAYDIREKCVPANFRKNFWAGMSSTQRSEQLNRFMKVSLHSNTGLLEFMREVDRALARKADTETQLNNASFDRPVSHKSSSAVVEVFHAAYTNEKFLEFFTEFKAMSLTNASQLTNIDHVIAYDIKERVVEPKWKRTWRDFQVTLNEEDGEFGCSCRLFEFKGILCRHILQVMFMEEIDYVPQKYVRTITIEKQSVKIQSGVRDIMF